MSTLKSESERRNLLGVRCQRNIDCADCDGCGKLTRTQKRYHHLILSSLILLILVASGFALLYFFHTRSASANQEKQVVDYIFLGAGSSMGNRIYSDMAGAANSGIDKEFIHTTVVYRPTGSEAGIDQLRRGQATWASTEIFMNEENQWRERLFYMPFFAAGIAFAANLPGMEGQELRLSRDNIADIFLGKITRWNDPKLVATNPGLKLPDLPLQLVYRRDGSGMASVVTRYLGSISDEWKKKTEKQSTIHFPFGVAETRMLGVLKYMVKTPGSFSFLEYSEAQDVGFCVAAIENADGNYLLPKHSNVKETFLLMEKENGNSGIAEIPVNPKGKNKYPIVAVNYLVLSYGKLTDVFVQRQKTAWEMIDWQLEYGRNYLSRKYPEYVFTTDTMLVQTRKDYHERLLAEDEKR